MKVLALAAAVIALFVAPASAHGPTRQKVVELVYINQPADQVWALIKDFDSLATWHPLVASSVADKGNEEGSIRKVVLKAPGNPGFDEVLDTYNAAKRTYKYDIPKVDPKILPVNDYESFITVLDDGKGGSIVEWKGAFYRGYMNNDPPPDLNDAASAAAVRQVYRAGLDNLKKIAEAER
ncbi:SRPBCC family protein [Rhodoblastus sp.]|uniref:SRPBCC family protein n=1 Tax=Rhodoblastus sp. TaxID=1962975 RepID=UPI003F991F08